MELSNQYLEEKRKLIQAIMSEVKISEDLKKESGKPYSIVGGDMFLELAFMKNEELISICNRAGINI